MSIYISGTCYQGPIHVETDGVQYWVVVNGCKYGPYNQTDALNKYYSYSPH